MTQEQRAESQRRALSSAEIAEIKAIAVDTNVYRTGGFRFHAPPFTNIGDTGNRSLHVLVPEVWERETLKHLEAWAEDRLQELRRISRHQEFGKPDQSAAVVHLMSQWEGETPKSLASRLLAEHMTQVRATKLPTP